MYAVYTAGVGASYSLSGVSSSNAYDVLGAMLASQEWTDLQDDFACYRVEGFYSTYSSTIGPGLTSVQALTPAFLALNYGHSSSVSVANIARSDSAVELKMNVVGAGKQTISYELPPLIIGANGYAVYGLDTWFSTATPLAAGNLIMMLGYLQVPTFASTASTQFIPVGVLDFHLKVRFAQPVLE